MLSDEQFCSCIEALTGLGVVEKVTEGDEREFLRLNLHTEGVIGRAFGGEFGEPPSGPGFVPWFSCIALKSLLDSKGVVVTKEEFTGMAAVVAGFMSEAEAALRVQSRHDQPVISQRGAKRRRK